MEDIRADERIQVLQVEDDDDHAMIVSRLLQHARIPVDIHRAKDGLEAMEYLNSIKMRQEKDLPQIILLDLKIPKKDGFEILSEIKGDPQLKSIPVVILTTSSVEQDKVKAYEYYANSYLIKPMNLNSFKRMVEELISYWGSWNSPLKHRDSNTKNYL